MNLRILFYSSILFITCISCQSNSSQKVKLNEYQTLESGLIYKYYEKGGGRKANYGDIIEFDFIEYHDGKETVNSFLIPEYFNRVILDKPHFDGDYMEGLSFVREGDSLLFKVVNSEKAEIAEGVDTIAYLIAVRAIWNEDSLVQNMTERLVQVANKERVETSNGLGIIIDSRGNGRKIDMGDSITVRYKALFTNGIPLPENWFHNQEPQVCKVGFQEFSPLAIEEAAIYLNYGDKVTIIAPHYLAYGNRDKAPVLKYSTIVFELDIEEEL